MDTIEDNISIVNELSVKFLAGNISVDEMSRLECLLNSNAEYLQLFLDIKESWVSASVYQSNEEELDTERSWENVSKRLGSQSQKNYVILRKVLKIAALWLLLLGIGSFSTWLMMGKKAPGRNVVMCEISTPLGSRSHSILPDGSEIWLNAGTTIRYPESFSSKQRDIYLIGEAFFKVKADKKWPFVVHVSEISVRALGTAFNVKAYPTDKTVETTLVEGIVNMENEGTAKKKFAYTLKPKEKLTYLKTPDNQKGEKNTAKVSPSAATINATDQSDVLVSENVNTTLSTSWKDARWVISGETLDNLAVLLERKFGVKINITSEELVHYKFSGTIENETLEQVLNYLKLTTPIKYTVNKGCVDLMMNENIKDDYKNYLKKSSNIN
jgi:transmembrane sensor